MKNVNNFMKLNVMRAASIERFIRINLLIYYYVLCIMWLVSLIGWSKYKVIDASN